MFLKAVYYVHPILESLIFLHNMEIIRIIRRKKIWRIRMVGQSTNRIFRGKIDVSWEQIWGISGFFMRVGSIINGDGGGCKDELQDSSVKGLLKQS